MIVAVDGIAIRERPQRIDERVEAITRCKSQAWGYPVPQSGLDIEIVNHRRCRPEEGRYSALALSGPGGQRLRDIWELAEPPPETR